MDTAAAKNHWETIYQTKSPQEVSWTQETPTLSLELIRSLNLSKTAKIIDVGGGESNLVDCLLAEGYENITVLDISASALERVKERLGDLAKKVEWIVVDITEFKPTTTYDVWHDRAVFHFLTTTEAINSYYTIVKDAVNETLIMGTFSTEGPLKCSGLAISQYSAESLSAIFEKDFQLHHHLTDDHETPFGTQQNFLYCLFNRLSQ